jgi:hypothetical protein
MRVISRVVLALAVGVVWAHMLFPVSAWEWPVHWFVSSVIAAAALGTVLAAWRRRPGVELAIGAFLLGAQAVIIACSLAGVRLVAMDMFPSRPLASVIGASLVLAVVGLVRRKMWARWLGLALGGVGAASGAWNAVKYWSITGAPDPKYYAWSMEMYLTSWLMWVSALGGALVVINLASSPVRDMFAARAGDTVWRSEHGLVKGLRATLLASFAAVPMLLVYAWLQPIVPVTRPSAFALAALLALAGFLTVRGKAIGAVALVLAGLGLGAQTAATFLDAAPAQREIAAYYAIFWLPAAALAVVTGIRLTAALVRKLSG